MPGFPVEAIRGPIRPSSDWEGKPKALLIHPKGGGGGLWHSVD